MAILKAETAKLGAPKVEGTDQTADKTTPGAFPGVVMSVDARSQDSS